MAAQRTASKQGMPTQQHVCVSETCGGRAGTGGSSHVANRAPADDGAHCRNRRQEEKPCGQAADPSGNLLERRIRGGTLNGHHELRRDADDGARRCRERRTTTSSGLAASYCLVLGLGILLLSVSLLPRCAERVCETESSHASRGPFDREVGRTCVGKSTF